MSLEKIFLHEKTVEIMLKILEAEKSDKDPYPLGISKEVGSPYSYISKVLSEFEANALIESEFKGRVRVVRFTEDGRKIAEMLRELKKELNKDFVARKKLSILKGIIEKANENEDKYKVLAPVIAELDALKNETDDEEVIDNILKLKETAIGMLK
ncbi:ArsR family transcriptional regulator [Archaeoglobales archaeon]|nr:MAG: ArsR family transcriptional regulator [Archaeoglobales archaeon]